MRGAIPSLPQYVFMAWCIAKHRDNFTFVPLPFIRGPFERFVDWRQCTGVMQKEAVTITPSCSSGGNVVVA
jgi:hypothetical protein